MTARSARIITGFAADKGRVRFCLSSIRRSPKVGAGGTAIEMIDDFVYDVDEGKAGR